MERGKGRSAGADLPGYRNAGNGWAGDAEGHKSRSEFKGDSRGDDGTGLRGKTDASGDGEWGQQLHAQTRQCGGFFADGAVEHELLAEDSSVSGASSAAGGVFKVKKHDPAVAPGRGGWIENNLDVSDLNCKCI